MGYAGYDAGLCVAAGTPYVCPGSARSSCHFGCGQLSRLRRHACCSPGCSGGCADCVRHDAWFGSCAGRALRCEALALHVV